MTRKDIEEKIVRLEALPNKPPETKRELAGLKRALEIMEKIPAGTYHFATILDEE